jgi:DNA-directed RNA polymerase specialized sigma24 family protein
MHESSFQQPSPEQLAAFVQGEPLAIDEVVHLLLPQLYRWAIRQHPHFPRDEVQSVVNEAFAEVCRNPDRFNPQKAKLTTYIIKLVKWRMAALGDAIKKISKISEEQENFSQETYNQLSTTEIEAHIVQERFFSKVMERLDDAEQEGLKLMLQEESGQDAYVAILTRYGSVMNPAGEVKNFKERLKRKVRIIARELGYESEDLLGE